MKPSYTVPAAMIELVDDRPIVKVIIDVSESVNLLAASLVNLSSECQIATPDDQTVHYIANTLLTSAISPFKSGSGNQQLTGFFPAAVHDRVKRIVDDVSSLVQADIVSAERFTENQVGDRIYPCTGLRPLSFREGNLAVLNYHIGNDPIDNSNDDPYADLHPFEKNMVEEMDQEASESIVVIEGPELTFAVKPGDDPVFERFVSSGLLKSWVEDLKKTKVEEWGCF